MFSSYPNSWLKAVTMLSRMSSLKTSHNFSVSSRIGALGHFVLLNLRMQNPYWWFHSASLVCITDLSSKVCSFRNMLMNISTAKTQVHFQENSILNNLLYMLVPTSLSSKNFRGAGRADPRRVQSLKRHKQCNPPYYMRERNFFKKY